MTEYLKRTLLNVINSLQRSGKPEENDCQRIVDEDDQVWYMEGWDCGVHSRWTIEKPLVAKREKDE